VLTKVASNVVPRSNRNRHDHPDLSASDIRGRLDGGAAGRPGRRVRPSTCQRPPFTDEVHSRSASRYPTRWDRAAIVEGVALVTAAMSQPSPGPYQIQAAIAALHGEAQRAGDTDWPQILALYTLLEQMTDNPVVTLNRAVAAAMVHGPRVGLALLQPLDADERIARHHRLDAVRAHMLEMAGDHQRAVQHYRAAARRTTNIAE
jgi:hypothetical protein